MVVYREFQVGSLGLAFFIPTHILLNILYFIQFGTHPLGFNDFILINGIFVLIYLLFYGMTITVSDEKILVSFGIGIIKRGIALNKIYSVDTVKNPWYYGWGIRFIPNGMLYNIGGSEGVELKMNSTGKVIRIGTKNPAQLRSEISRRLSK